MSTTDQRRVTGRTKALLVLFIMVALGLIVVLGLLLREHGPGNMGTGLLVGAGVGVLAVVITAWRITRNPSGATSIERAFTSHGDEREDALLTRSLAVLGLSAVPLTGAAAIAIGLGAGVSMVLALLLFAEVLVGVMAWVAISRRS